MIACHFVRTSLAYRLLSLLDRFHVHYGYFLFFVCGVLLMLAGVHATFSMGVFTESLLSACSLSRSEYSLCWSAAMLATAGAMPLAGRAIDRYGVRAVALGVAVPYTIGLICVPLVSGPFSLTGTLIVNRLSINTVGLLCQNLTNNWWVRRKGFAMALMNIVGNLVLMWPTILAIIDDGDFRRTYYILAAACGPMMAAASALALDRPETYGRNTDADKGDQADDASESASSTSSAVCEVHWYWRDAVRTPLFFVVMASSFSCSLLWSGFNLYFVSIFEESGITESIKGNIGDLVFIPITFTACVGMYFIGKLFDGLSHKVRGLLVSSVSQSAALIVLMTMPAIGATGIVWMAYVWVLLFALLYGLMDSTGVVGYAIVFGYSFGRLELATIDAIASLIQTLAIGVGPLVFGLSKDYAGSFQPVIGAVLAWSIVAAIGLATIGPLKTPSRQIQTDGLMGAMDSDAIELHARNEPTQTQQLSQPILQALPQSDSLPESADADGLFVLSPAGYQPLETQTAE